ncbi:MAG: hypothetical protein WD768_11030 [Phycisphaeraceae bacterium]
MLRLICSCLCLSALLGLAGCGTPMRIVSDGTGSAVIPLRGLGDGFPKEVRSALHQPGVVDADSLYVRIYYNDRGYRGYIANVYRFWEGGQSLIRGQFLGSDRPADHEPIVTRIDGDVRGEQLAIPPGVLGATVGVYKVVADDIYIENFDRHFPGGPTFRVYHGKIDENGFTLHRYYDLTGLFPNWKDWKAMEQPLRYIRHRVGPMEGSPTW